MGLCTILISFGSRGAGVGDVGLNTVGMLRPQASSNFPVEIMHHDAGTEIREHFVI